MGPHTPLGDIAETIALKNSISRILFPNQLN